ncbi:MAG TPA: hypothetical protein ENJ54_00240 [Chloroflexi bacterium]|nr:hypothetical protein [Chloroflexota bacterium]
MAKLFQLGQLLATPGFLALGLDQDTVFRLLHRHVTGDWSEMDAEDQAANAAAVRTGARVFSAYKVRRSDGKVVKVWIITEAVYRGRRASTTLLLPEEY